MIAERQQIFRENYRSRLVGWYNGYAHVLIIYGIGAGLLYLFINHISAVDWWEWLTVPIAFLLSNIFEWSVHRYVMHRPINFPGLIAVYNRHTLNHHQFFTDSEIRFLSHRDWRVTVFPTYALVVFYLDVDCAGLDPRPFDLVQCRLVGGFHHDWYVSAL